MIHDTGFGITVRRAALVQSGGDGFILKTGGEHISKFGVILHQVGWVSDFTGSTDKRAAKRQFSDLLPGVGPREQDML